MAKSTALSAKSITAKISSFENGLTEINNIQAIRLISKNYNLLIMIDFQSTLGEVEEGKIEFICADNVHEYKDINGYYVLKNNVFSLLINEE